MTQPPFILASSSPRRQELIASLGITYTIIKPEIDETRAPDESPQDYVQRLSREKAAAVVARLDAPATVLAADTTVIEQGGDILEKPVDAADARRMLRRLRGRDHRVCTSVTIVQTGDTPREMTEVTCTTVTMRPYTDAEIDAYIATGDPFDKAGGYAIQHDGFAPVAHIEGSYTNVVGLPVETVKAMLGRLGWSFHAS